MSKRETIIAALAAAAGTPLNPATGVYRSREDAMSATEGGSVVIAPTEEEVSELTIGLVECRLGVEVSVFARGSVPDQIADPVAQAVHGRLMTDPTLGGLAIDMMEEGSRWEFDGSDETSLWLTTTYRVWYRRARNSLA